MAGILTQQFLGYKEAVIMLREKSVLSGLFGLAVGDALGVPVEFMSREMLDKSPVRKMLVM